MRREFTAGVFGQASPGDAAAVLAACFSAPQLVIPASCALKLRPEEPHASSGVQGSSCLRSSDKKKRLRYHDDGE